MIYDKLQCVYKCRCQPGKAFTVKLYDLQNNMDLTRLSAPTQKDLDRLKRYQSEYDYLKQKQEEL